MQVLAHAGIGWALAEAGRGTRRFRQVVFLSSLLPDLDGLSVLFGLAAYGTYHGVVTHAVAFSLAVSAAGAALCRGERFRAFAFTQLAFWSHVIGDYLLSGWALALWFPFSRAVVIWPHALSLFHPVNTALSILGLAYILWLGRRFKRTPIEVFSPQLDERIVNLLFEPKTLSCGVCARPANETCSRCGTALCPRHVSLTLRFAPTCPRCRGSTAKRANPDDAGPARPGPREPDARR